MHTTPKAHPLVLAIFPTAIGFGYSVHRDARTFIDWGIKWTTSDDKNKDCVRGFIRLINYYQPTILVLEHIPDADSPRRSRTIELIAALKHIASAQGIDTHQYSRAQIQEAFEASGASSKQEIAETVGSMIPELEAFIPPARKVWETDQDAMSFFSAASLALTHFHFTPQD